MNYQNILILAMKREEYSKKPYKALSQEIENFEIKKLFLRLGQEEIKHKLKFWTMSAKKILTEN